MSLKVDYSNIKWQNNRTLPEEASFYTSVNKPISVVCIRTATERPEALDKG